MQNLLWIGSPFFCAELNLCGWGNVALHNFEEARVFCWEDLLSIAGFTPDVLVVADKSRPPFVLGVENFPCLTVFYSVDSHIHSWHPRYAQAFDVCLHSLLDHRERFISANLPPERVFWSPPFAKTGDQPDAKQEKIWDCLFVGTVNDNLPRRAAFLRELQKRLPGLCCKRGDYRELYPKAHVILNHAERGDMNFRIFEAMGCGGCLVTPRVGHGMERLFVDGEHLVGYVPNDVGDALFRIEFLLKNPEVVRHIKVKALAKINEKHRARHRAQAFTDLLCDVWAQGAERLVARRRGRAESVRENCLKLIYLLWAQDVTHPPLKEAWLAASTGRFGLAGIV
jgi:hypothetical protein